MGKGVMYGSLAKGWPKCFKTISGIIKKARKKLTSLPSTRNRSNVEPIPGRSGKDLGT